MRSTEIPSTIRLTGVPHKRGESEQLMHWGWYGNCGNLGFHTLFSALLWVGVIGGIILLVKSLTKNQPAEVRKVENSALDVARERYAKGEITRAEYEEIRATLLKD